MAGNFADLRVLLSWLNELITATAEPDDDDDDDEGESPYLFAEEVRLRIAKVSVMLLHGFDHAETAHRTAFGLTGADKTKKVSDSSYKAL